MEYSGMIVSDGFDWFRIHLDGWNSVADRRCSLTRQMTPFSFHSDRFIWRHYHNSDTRAWYGKFHQTRLVEFNPIQMISISWFWSWKNELRFGRLLSLALDNLINSKLIIAGFFFFTRAWYGKLQKTYSWKENWIRIEMNWRKWRLQNGALRPVTGAWAALKQRVSLNWNNGPIKIEIPVIFYKSMIWKITIDTMTLIKSNFSEIPEGKSELGENAAASCLKHCRFYGWFILP